MAHRGIMGGQVSATLSVVIPAFDEEACLPATLEHVRAAASKLKEAGAGQAEVVVVDNASTDATTDNLEWLVHTTGSVDNRSAD